MKAEVIKVLLIGHPDEDYHRLLGSLDRRFVLYQAVNGEGGLNLYATVRPHCIVMEFEQADMGALELLSALQLRVGKNEVPIFVWTCALHPIPPLAAAALGLAAYVQKTPGSHARLAKDLVRRMGLDKAGA